MIELHAPNAVDAYAEGIGHVLWPVVVMGPDALCPIEILAQFVDFLKVTASLNVIWNAITALIGPQQYDVKLAAIQLLKMAHTSTIPTQI